MRNNYKGLDFEHIQTVLGGVDSEADAAEAQGLLCGLLCADPNVRAEAWAGSVLGAQASAEPLAGEAREMLGRLYERTRDQLMGGEYSLALLLPDDEEPLDERVESLAHWCQAFLVGLATGGLKDMRTLPDEAAEFARDLLDISRAGIEPDEDSEQGETDFAEIVEYVRIGVFVIYSELRSEQARERPALH
jgi:uncharacterized protein YgfB (UPF0149 family)